MNPRTTAQMSPSRRRSLEKREKRGRIGGFRTSGHKKHKEHKGKPVSDYDEQKVDEAVPALLWLTRWREKKDWPWRAWKGHDWDTMNRLHEAGFISDPHN